MVQSAGNATFRFPRPTLLASFSGYRTAFLSADLLAGLTLAAIAIPEQMATARLGALPPQAGFAAFIAASIAFALFGASRRLSAGADSTITPIFAGALALLAASGSPHYGALAAALAIAVGLTVAAAGFLRMGWIGNLLSAPVMLGFLAGIAVHIIVSQAPAALGVPAPSGGTLARLQAVIGLIPQARPAAVLLSIGTLGLITILHRLSPRLPGPLLAVILAAVAASLFHLQNHGANLLGPVEGGLPTMSLPALSYGELRQLLPLAFLVALVVMVQTAATTRAFPPDGAAANVSADFVGVGAANFVAGFFAAFPVNASPPRTAIVTEAGGRSQMAGLTAAAAVAALLVFGTGLLSRIPEAALAGVLFFVALRILRLGPMAAVFAASRLEGALIVLTAASIVWLPIESGVALGITASLLQGVWSSARAHIEPLVRVGDSSVWWPGDPDKGAEADQTGVAVLAYQAPLTFLNADGFAAEFLAAIAPGRSQVRLAVLEAAGVIDIDYTAAQALRSVIMDCRAGGVVFALARLESVAAQQALSRLGLRDLIGADHIFDSVAHAIEALGPKADPSLGAGRAD